MRGVPIDSSGDILDSIVYNGDGLAPAIVQDAESRAVLMMAWVNPETLALTLQEGRTVFWSRSRQTVWRKGETSGARQWLREAYYDCDRDSLLFVVDQQRGGACHTGEYSCFYRSFAASDVGEAPGSGASDGLASADRGAGAGS